MLELFVNNLRVSYGGEAVLENFSFDFSADGAFALMGPSGVGRTTLLHSLAGLIKPQMGSIGGFAAAKCALMFQEDRLLEHLTARENAALPSNDAAAVKYLTALDLGDKMDATPPELSGGQRRRVALARALAFGGDVLLLDEPFTGLDEELKKLAAPLLRASFRHIIFSTHDIAEARLLNALILSL